MPYEIQWTLVIMVWFLVWAVFTFVKSQLREKVRFKRKFQLRELLHKERLAALEKDIPLVEIPTLDDELFAIDEDHALPLSPEQRRQRWFRFGILFISGGLGTALGFYFSKENNLSDVWSIGLIGVSLGCGCLIISHFDRR